MISGAEQAGRASSRFAAAIASYSGVTLLFCLALTLLAAGAIYNPFTGHLGLRINPSIGELLSASDPDNTYYEAIRERFGNDDTLVVAIERDDLWSAEGLADLRALSRRLESLDEVTGVLSLASALRVEAQADGVEIRPYLSQIPDDDAGRRALREDVLGSRLYGGSLVSSDGRMAAMIIQFREIPEERFIEERFDLEIKALAHDYSGSGEVWMAGTPHVKAETSGILLADLARQVPVILLLMFMFSAIATRSTLGTVVPVATLVVALIWTMGFVAAIGHELNIITTLIPPLVLIVGFAYVIHVVMAHWSAARAHGGEGAASRDLATRALEHSGFPVLLTAITTMAGFLSLQASPIDVVKQFGLLASAGVFAASLASLTFAPALLARARPPDPARGRALEDRLDGWAGRLGRWDVRQAPWILAAGAGIAIASVLGMLRIEVNTETIENFRPDAEVRRGFDAIAQRLEGGNSFYVVIEGEANSLKEPAVLRDIQALQGFLEAQPEVGGTTSIADYVSVLHRVFQGGDLAEERIPESARLVSQLLFFGPRDAIGTLVDGRYETAVIQVRTSASSSRDLADLTARIERQLAGLSDGLTGETTGGALLVTHTVDRISEGQTKSLGVAFGLILTILVIYFRSLRLGLLALVPNALPILFYFGFMGWSGISLNNATALMGSMALGIAVDDTIHFLVHYRRNQETLGDRAGAANAALAAVGRPVSYTTLVLCLGLLVIAQSDLETQASFGILGSLTLAFAWLIDVVFTPALCSRMPVKG